MLYGGKGRVVGREVADKLGGLALHVSEVWKAQLTRRVLLWTMSPSGDREDCSPLSAVGTSTPLVVQAGRPETCLHMFRIMRPERQGSRTRRKQQA